MRWDKKLIRKPAVQKTFGHGLAGYLRLVGWTSRLRKEPADLEERLLAEAPVIFCMWHGQHFMVPVIRPRSLPSVVMISRHAEAEVNAIAARQMGLETIRASGVTPDSRRRNKGGVAGFREALKALEGGLSLAITADVPKGPAKVAGRGVVMIAKHSGRPIVPVAYATSRTLRFNTWDDAVLNLPFSRAGLVVGDPIRVPRDADGDAVERYRDLVKDGLDRATVRAYQLVGREWPLPGEVVHG